jgi:SAM-dependent methyltransferase
MLKVAREKHPDHCFMKATIEEFVAEPDYGFDSAISVFCALNYCDNLRGSLESIHECLNPDGRVFVGFHGARRILEPSYCETMSAVGFDPTDTVFYSPEEIRGYMEEAQFNNIGVFGFNRGDQPDWAPQWWLERDIIDGVTVTRIPPADSRYVITTGLV